MSFFANNSILNLQLFCSLSFYGLLAVGGAALIPKDSRGQDRLRPDLIDSNQSRQGARRPVVKLALLQMELNAMTALT